MCWSAPIRWNANEWHIRNGFLSLQLPTGETPFDLTGAGLGGYDVDAWNVRRGAKDWGAHGSSLRCPVGTVRPPCLNVINGILSAFFAGGNTASAPRNGTVGQPLGASGVHACSVLRAV